MSYIIYISWIALTKERTETQHYLTTLQLLIKKTYPIKEEKTAS
jgi:hypothetical protein